MSNNSVLAGRFCHLQTGLRVRRVRGRWGGLTLRGHDDVVGCSSLLISILGLSQDNRAVLRASVGHLKTDVLLLLLLLVSLISNDHFTLLSFTCAILTLRGRPIPGPRADGDAGRHLHFTASGDLLQLAGIDHDEALALVEVVGLNHDNHVLAVRIHQGRGRIGSQDNGLRLARSAILILNDELYLLAFGGRHLLGGGSTLLRCDGSRILCANLFLLELFLLLDLLDPGRGLGRGHVQVEQMLATDVQFEIDMGRERPPTVEAKERQLSSMEKQMVLQADRNLEDGVALGAHPVLGVAILVLQVAEAVKHDLIAPSELAIAIVARELAVARGPVPVNSTDEAVAQVELVVDLPLLETFGPEVVHVHAFTLPKLSLLAGLLTAELTLSLLLLLLELNQGLEKDERFS